MTETGLTYSQGVISDSKATLISIVPFPITELKPGLIPGEFHIEASKDEAPVFTVIGDSFYYVYIDADRGSLRVPAPSVKIAQSICYDYLTAQLEVKPHCHPGLFFKPGIWTAARVKAEAMDDLNYNKESQFNWFTALVKRADDDWEKTRSHYSISDIQRYALRAIDPKNVKNRPWILPAQPEDNASFCPSCGSEVSPIAVVCKYCHFVLNAEKHRGMVYENPGIAGRVIHKQ